MCSLKKAFQLNQYHLLEFKVQKTSQPLYSIKACTCEFKKKVFDKNFHFNAYQKNKHDFNVIILWWIKFHQTVSLSWFRFYSVIFIGELIEKPKKQQKLTFFLWFFCCCLSKTGIIEILLFIGNWSRCNCVKTIDLKRIYEFVNNIQL